MINKHLIIAGLLAALSGCQSTQTDTSSTLAVAGSWTINSVMGQSIFVESPAKITFEKEGKTFGNNGCNSFFGQYSLDGNNINVMQAGQTLMMCPDPLMAQAILVDDAIQLAVTAKMNMNKLELADKNGDVVLILSKL